MPSAARRLNKIGAALHPARPTPAAADDGAGAACVSVVDGDTLRAWVKALLGTIGVDEFCATAVSEGLVEASLRGVDSHGIRLLPNYVENCLEGGVNPTPKWGVRHPFPAMVVLDADDGFGLAAGRKAMEVGMEVAAQQGVCLIAVQNSHHPGAMASTTLHAARRGFVAWGHTNTGPKLSTFGSKGTNFGTNPVAFAAPRGSEEEPFSLDMATSMIPWNKVRPQRLISQRWRLISSVACKRQPMQLGLQAADPGCAWCARRWSTTAPRETRWRRG